MVDRVGHGRAVIHEVDRVPVVDDGLQSLGTDEGRSGGHAQVPAVGHAGGPRSEVPGLEAVTEDQVGRCDGHAEFVVAVEHPVRGGPAAADSCRRY